MVGVSGFILITVARWQGVVWVWFCSDGSSSSLGVCTQHSTYCTAAVPGKRKYAGLALSSCIAEQLEPHLNTVQQLYTETENGQT
jgi:hypothetical protein